MIRTVTDEIRNETFYYDTRRRRWVDPEEVMPEDDNFELEDEADAGKMVPVP